MSTSSINSLLSSLNTSSTTESLSQLLGESSSSSFHDFERHGSDPGRRECHPELRHQHFRKRH